MSTHVLAVGPISPPITGQSVAFENYVKNSELDIDTFNISTEHTFLMKFLKRFLHLFIYLYKVITTRYDALYITTSRSNKGFIFDVFYIFLFKTFTKGKIINHLHGSDFYDFRKNSKLKFLIDYTYKKINVSIVLTERMQEQYINYPHMNIHVVSNFSSAMLDENIALQKSEKLLDRETISIIYLSNIMYSKGIIHFLDAFNELNDSEKRKIKISIAGDFIADQYCNVSEIKNLFHEKINNNKNIHYLGVLNNTKKVISLTNSEIFILPTFYKTEAQPISIIEAMSHACLIIATDHNYNLELINSDCAVILSKNNLKTQIKESLKSILEMKDKNEYKNKSLLAYNLAISNFSQKKYTMSIDKIIKDCLCIKSH